MRSRSRNVLLTGASSGIGRALALELAAGGNRLALVARRRELLDDVASAIEARGAPRPVVMPADLAVPGEARRVAEAAVQALGEVDVLINNAGGGAGGVTWRASDGPQARESFEVNYWSPLALISAVVPQMLERGSGTIVNVTSLAQVMTWPAMGPYTATKAALGLATETLRLELAGTGVHVVEVIPGPVDTAMQAESALLSGLAEALRTAPVGNPQQLAKMIATGIDRGTDRLVYPRRLALAYRFPGVTRAVVARQARRFAHVLDDARVMRSGSRGDDAAQAARGEWAARTGGVA